MTAIDRLNDRYGRGTARLASAGLSGERRTWAMRQARRTPAYMTRWEDTPVIRA